MLKGEVGGEELTQNEANSVKAESEPKPKADYHKGVKETPVYRFPYKKGCINIYYLSTHIWICIYILIYIY